MVDRFKKNLIEPKRFKKDWRCWVLNPGPSACKADALPLSYIPSVVTVSHTFRLPSESDSLPRSVLSSIILYSNASLHQKRRSSDIFLYKDSQADHTNHTRDGQNSIH